jgi:hypothetical protein
MDENYIKLRFFLDPADWHGSSAELLWTEPIWGGTTKVFRLMNSPFFARGVSYLDVVRAIPAPDGLGLDYAGTIEKSGHSTIWLMVPSGPPAGFHNYWVSLQKLHCNYEGEFMNTAGGGQTLYAIDVRPEADIGSVLSIIEEGQANNVWNFQIGDLVHKRETA